jgi:hypothetical protein
MWIYLDGVLKEYMTAASTILERQRFQSRRRYDVSRLEDGDIDLLSFRFLLCISSAYISCLCLCHLVTLVVFLDLEIKHQVECIFH